MKHAFARLITGCAVGVAACGDPEVVPTRDRGSSVSPLLSEAEFVDEYLAESGLDADHQLIHVRGGPSRIAGYDYALYQHVYQGLMVEGEGLRLHLRDGFVVSGVGDLRADMPKTRPRISSAVAVSSSQQQIAREAGVDPRSIMWTLGRRPCELFIGPRGPRSAMSLLYRCTLHAQRPVLHYDTEVTDQGTVVRADPRMSNAFVPDFAGGTTLYNGDVGPFAAERDDVTGEYRLRADSPGAYTLNANGLTPSDLPFGQDYTSPSSQFPAGTAAGVSVHWAVLETHEWYLEHLAWPMGAIASYVNVNLNQNAMYTRDGDYLVFGNIPVDAVSLDLVAHEMTHAFVTRNGLEPIPAKGEYGAIHESLGDIVGELVELRTLGTSDWRSGAELAPYGFELRSFVQPHLTSAPLQPDVYQGAHWGDPSSVVDSGYVHRNSSIQNAWFYLLGMGGAGSNSDMATFAVEGIGEEEAIFFLWTALIEELLPGDGFDAMRIGTETVVGLQCGEFSREMISTHNAWHAVGLESSPIGPTYVHAPGNGMSGVAPWPARIEWQARHHFLETAWDLEVSENPGFDPSTTLHPPAVLVQEGGVDLGRAEVVLEANRTYYWRVREAGVPEGLRCWRPTMHFTTSAQQPALYFPGGSNVPPWKNHFFHSSIAGATHYEIEVGRDDALNVLVFPVKTFPVDVDPDVSAELTVPVDSELYWRARAKYSTDGAPPLFGQWSNSKRFETSLPGATIVGPAGGVEYPWPVVFQWEFVQGGEFDINLRSDSSEYPFTRHLTELESVTLPLKVRADSTSLTYTWDLGVIGPPWGSPAEPEPDSTREEGVRAPEVTFTVYGADVQPQLIAPIWDPNAPSCLPFYEPTDFSWTPVPGAEYYELIFDSPSESKTYHAPGSHFEMRPPFHDLGSEWTVRAMGNEEASGLDAQEAIYYVRAAPPAILFSSPVATHYSSDVGVVPLDVYGFFSHQGRYDVSLSWDNIPWWSIALSGDPSESVGTVTLTGAPDNSQFTVLGRNLLPGHYTWEVREYNDPAYCGATPNTPTTSTFTVDEPYVPCNTTVVAGGNLADEKLFSLGATSGTISMNFKTYEIHDEIEVYQDGVLILSTGCISTPEDPFVPEDVTLAPWMNVQAPFSGSGIVTVLVTPNCEPTTAADTTQWTYELLCP